MLTVWNPFVPVKKSEYRTIFDSFFKNMFDLGINQSKNEDGSFSIGIDMPGIKESDINIHLCEDNVVTIKGTRKTSTSTYEVDKSFVLPDECDPDTLSANLKDGVLTLSLASKKKQETKEPKKIPITVK